MDQNRSGPVFNAGRDLHTAYAEQGNATLNANISNVSGSTDIDVLAELQALQGMLAQLGPATRPSTALLEAATQAASVPNPSQYNVASYVESAVKLARTASGFAEQVDKLIPRLQHIAAWAGQTWDAWRPALGL